MVQKKAFPSASTFQFDLNKLTRKLNKKHPHGVSSSGIGFRWSSLNRSWGRKSILYLLGAMLLWALSWGIPSWAKASASPDPSGPRKETVGKEKEEIEKVWLAHRAFWAKGDWENSFAELEKTYQWKLDQGIRNHYPYSLALVRESQRLASRGKSGAIPELLNYAEKMAPDFSQVHNARAAWLWSQIPQSVENATKAVMNWFRGFLLSFDNLEAFT